MKYFAVLAAASLVLTGCENQNQLSAESPQEENSGDDENYVAGDTEPKTEQFETREILNEVDWLEEVGSTEQFIEASEPAGLREDGSGAFRTHCIESHLAEDDPLVWPGEPGQSHLHVFFGNPNVDAYTTSESLLDAEQTTCDGVSVNKSGYWVPALLKRKWRENPLCRSDFLLQNRLSRSLGGDCSSP
jgi:hypothetical protein